MRLDDEAQIVTFALVDPVIEEEETDSPEVTDLGCSCNPNYYFFHVQFLLTD